MANDILGIGCSPVHPLLPSVGSAVLKHQEESELFPGNESTAWRDPEEGGHA